MDEKVRKELRKRYGFELAVHRQNGDLKDVAPADLDAGMALRAAYDETAAAFETYVQSTGSEDWNILAFCTGIGQLLAGIVDLSVPEEQREYARKIIKNAIDGKTLDQLFD